MFCSRLANMLSIFIIFFFFSSSVHSAMSQTLEKIPLPSAGPVSYAFNLRGEGPFLGVADGRVIKYQGKNNGFLDFATTVPNRSKELCDGYTGTDLGPVCGRPVGVKFNHATGQLYLTDPFQGLLVVGPQGGLATLLATSADGVRLRSPDSVDVDQASGLVYFTDPSTVYGLDQFGELLNSNDSTGRLLKYDPKSKQVNVLLNGLAGSGGVAISKDSSFLLVTEFKTSRIRKYWLKGPKANTAEILLNLTGNPEKIRSTLTGDFWVGVTIRNQPPQLTGIRINQFGTVLETLTFSPQFNESLITEVYQQRSALFLGSTTGDYIGVYRQGI